MSVVIIGGHDRMVCTYKDICRQFNCTAKVFTQQPANLRTQIGRPDLLQMTKNTNTEIVRSHSSSSCALKNILSAHC